MSKFKILIFIFPFLLVSCMLIAQQKYTIQLLYTHDSLSFRGLSIPTDSIIWVSGSKGTVGKSINGGKTWEWLTVPGYEQRDFRDIEGFDANTAIIMAIAEPAHILKTTDGGKNWKVVFADTTKGMFLDAMHFRDANHGIVVGDPVDGKFFIRGTGNGGESWNISYTPLMSKPGEACFAASGTNIILQNKDKYVIVTGGKESRWIQDKTYIQLPMIQGKESTGANSVASWQEATYVIVGGDFQKDKDTVGNCVLSVDGGKTWKKPKTSPHGYRSCVTFLDKNTLIACGTSGVDISMDGGMRWQLISIESFHVCQKAKKGKAIFLAGAKGKIAKLVFH